MARHARKGKNPGPIDAWLDNLGYYRKNVAYDETCLFRAVSEQLYSCQIHHERCRQAVIDYGRANYEEFDTFMPKEQFLKHLVQLEVHMVICGNLELQIVSKRYKKNIVLFDGTIKKMSYITPNNYDDALMLCSMGGDHYDVVYKKEYIRTAGFCQSIVYGLLYENVFDIPNVIKIVETMLYEKTTLMVVNSECNEENLKNNEKAKKENDIESTDKKNYSALNDYEYMLQTNIAPFPFKVAKALDENIYRNIEYDTWTEIRKELRLGQWYYGDNNLILGTCCLLSTSDAGLLQCYIQEIKKGTDECVVYVTHLAEKRTVKYSDLAPETDAKPWPLPYRFAKHSNAVPPPEVKPIDVNNNTDKGKRSLRRRRDNKRNQRCSSNDSGPTLTIPMKNEIVTSSTVKDFEGSPLHMQQSVEDIDRHVQLIDNQQSIDYENYIVSNQWIKAGSTTEQVVPRNPGLSQNIYPYVPKQVIALSPEVTYTDTLYNAQPTQAWATATDQLPTPPEHFPISPQEVLISPNPYPYYYDQLYQSPLVPITTLAPTSPHMPFYPPIATAAPTTSLVYTSGQEAQDVIIMSPPVIDSYTAGIYSPGYNPPIDMSFISPSFVYPPTPAWYRPPPIDAQGFIFPTAIASQK